MIPKQLQKEEIKFCLVYGENKKKGSSKPIYFNKGWTKGNNYSYNDPELLNHLKKGGNYGVIGGYGNLVIIDFDTQEYYKKKKPLLPKTFVVSSGGRGLPHYYYFLDKPIKAIQINDEQFKFVKKEDCKINEKTGKPEVPRLADIQGIGRCCIGAGSKFQDTNEYKIIDDSEIKHITKKELLSIFTEINKENNNNIFSKDSRVVNTILCPFHEDHNPSLQIYEDGGGFCFACNSSATKEAIEKPTKATSKTNKQGGKHYYIQPKNTEGLDVIIARTQDPIELAKKFCEKQPVYYDKSKIWWLWENNKWNITDETDIINSIRQSYDILGLVQSNFKNQLLDALKLVGRENKPKEAPKEWVQYGNKVYDINTGEEFIPTPEHFFTNVCPYTPSNNEETPNLDQLFTEWVGEKYVRTLYEIIAYCTYRGYPIHRIFIFIGAGLNGKGTFFNILNIFLGVLNIASTELDNLISNRFESAKLYKKLVAQMSETNTNTLKQTSLLKKLSGDDLIGFEMKNKDPFDDKNYAKILVSTNSLPKTTDRTKGFYRRMMIIPFNNQFTEKKDVLKTIPEQEYHNLSRKSINILKTLLEQREFTNEGSIQERTQAYEELSNPLERFLKEQFSTKDPDSYFPKFEFQEHFETWLQENGYRKLSSVEVGSQMKKLGFEDRKKPYKREGEKKYWNSWLGIQLKMGVLL